MIYNGTIKKLSDKPDAPKKDDTKKSEEKKDKKSENAEK